MTNRIIRNSLVLSVLVAMTALGRAAPPERDWHSASNPEHVRVTHLDLDLRADFDKKQLRGTVTLTLQRTSSDATQPLILDTRDLIVEKTESSRDGKNFETAAFAFGTSHAILGQSLTVPLPASVKAVRVTYATGPRASALQWLSPAQTVGKKHPYLFTQSQAIEARSWIPLQDTPAARFTYSARIRTPKDLLALMSAANDPKQARTGEYHFEMNQAIPPYLMALAIGDLEFRPLGPRTGVYAEPAVVARAAAEFADVEEIVKACETLFGPYRWERYDLLIMPPSFPFGGMENPRLTFASPTTLAGDKSLVSLVAHELAHSWSGNLVSNATWRDFWLNEGFTVYLERRIMEVVYGQARAEAEAMLGRRSLGRDLAGLPKRDQVLHIDLKNRTPSDGLTDVPYEKGALFLKHLEIIYGRERFDAFLKKYFEHFAFRSIRTADFSAYLEEHLLKEDAAKAAKANVTEWLFAPGLPKDAPNPSSPGMAVIETKAATGAPPEKTWGAVEWLVYLNALPADVGTARLKALDEVHQLTKSTNAEILFRWLMLSVQNNYSPAMARLEGFLTEQGRVKFLKPLYEELVKSPAGRKRAKAVYAKARAGYHPAAQEAVDSILGPDFAALETVLTEEMKALNVPGVVLVVIQGDKVTYAKGYGVASVETNEPVTPDHLFRIGSTTKMFTGAALAKLAADGKVSLQEPIGNRIDGLPPKLAALTTHQLLTHTAGLSDEAPMFGLHDDTALGDGIRKWKDDRFFTKPGDVYSYSNPGYWLAGYVAERAAGKPFADVLAAEIFGPLGMKRTTFRPTTAMTWPLAQGHQFKSGKLEVIRPFADNAATWPAGSMFASGNDLARFTIAVLNAGQLDGKQVLPVSVMKSIATPYVERHGDRGHYGYGLSIATQRGVDTISHGGARSGFGSHIAMAPAHKTAVILLANRSGASLPRTLAKAAELLLPLGPIEVPAKTTQPTPEELAKLAGVYANGAMKFELKWQAGSLMLAGSQKPVTSLGGLRFRSADGALFEIVRGRDGSSTYFVQGGRALRKLDE